MTKCYFMRKISALRYNLFSSTRQYGNKREMVIGFQTYSVEMNRSAWGVCEGNGRSWWQKVPMPEPIHQPWGTKEALGWGVKFRTVFLVTKPSNCAYLSYGWLLLLQDSLQRLPEVVCVHMSLDSSIWKDESRHPFYLGKFLRWNDSVHLKDHSLPLCYELSNYPNLKFSRKTVFSIKFDKRILKSFTWIYSEFFQSSVRIQHADDHSNLSRNHHKFKGLIFALFGNMAFILFLHGKISWQLCDML